jgi:hypothetical protein
MKSVLAVLAAAGSAMVRPYAPFCALHDPPNVSLSQAASGLVPSGISESCSSYLGRLDAGTTLTPCTNAINTATKAFAASSSPSGSDVQSALSNLCAPAVASACSDTAIRAELAAFYQACTPELTTSPNDMVKVIYDALYTVSPLHTAMCTKDDSSAYCGASSSAVPAAKDAQKYLGSTTDGVSYPNATTWAASNVAFLFLSKQLASSDCNTCTRQVVTSFMTWESSTSYAPGFGSSALLANQASMYASVNSVCGASFLSNGPVNAAGGVANSVAGAANGAVTVKATGSAATFLVAAFAAAALF